MASMGDGTGLAAEPAAAAAVATLGGDEGSASEDDEEQEPAAPPVELAVGLVVDVLSGVGRPRRTAIVKQISVLEEDEDGPTRRAIFLYTPATQRWERRLEHCLGWAPSKQAFPSDEASTCMDLVTTGDVEGSLPPPGGDSSAAPQLPAAETLRTWTWESQFAFWQQRLEHWGGVSLAGRQQACRSRGLWPGGRSKTLRDRLVMHEFDPVRLLAADRQSHWERAASPPRSSSDGPRAATRTPKEQSSGRKRARRLTDSDDSESDDSRGDMEILSLSSSEEELPDDALGEIDLSFIDNFLPGKPLPEPSLTERAMGDTLDIYAHLQVYSAMLKLTMFPLEQFMCALASSSENKLLSEVHMCALRVLTNETLEESKEDYIGQQDHYLLTWVGLNGITWPEHLRRFTAAQVATKPEARTSILGPEVLKLLQREYWTLEICEKVQILGFLCECLMQSKAFSDMLNQRVDEHEELNSKKKITAEEEAEIKAKYQWPASQCGCCGEKSNVRERGPLVKCDGCSNHFHQMCKKLEKDSTTGASYCGMCCVTEAFAVGLTSLGSDRKGNRYWFVGAHLFREVNATGEFFQVSDNELEVWKRVRKGTIAEIQLGKAIRDISPMLRDRRLPERLCNAFYATQQFVDDQLDDSESDGESQNEGAQSSLKTLDTAINAATYRTVNRNCEMCGKSHDASYATGRFCSRVCAARFSTQGYRESMAGAQPPGPMVVQMKPKLELVYGLRFDPTGYSNYFFHTLTWQQELTHRYCIHPTVMNSWPITKYGASLTPRQENETMLSSLRHARNLLLRADAAVPRQYKSEEFNELHKFWLDRVNAATTASQLGELMLAFEKAIHCKAFKGGWLHGAGVLNDHSERTREKVIPKVLAQCTLAEAVPAELIVAPLKVVKPLRQRVRLGAKKRLLEASSPMGSPNAATKSFAMASPTTQRHKKAKKAAAKVHTIGIPAGGRTIEMPITVLFTDLIAQPGEDLSSKSVGELLGIADERMVPINHKDLHGKDMANKNACRLLQGVLQGVDFLRKARRQGLFCGAAPRAKRLIALPNGTYAVEMPAELVDEVQLPLPEFSETRNTQPRVRPAAGRYLQATQLAERTCEMCSKRHSGAYGSGRFCARECAARYSTQSCKMGVAPEGDVVVSALDEKPTVGQDAPEGAAQDHVAPDAIEPAKPLLPPPAVVKVAGQQQLLKLPSGRFAITGLNRTTLLEMAPADATHADAPGYANPLLGDEPKASPPAKKGPSRTSLEHLPPDFAAALYAAAKPPAQSTGKDSGGVVCRRKASQDPWKHYFSQTALSRALGLDSGSVARACRSRAADGGPRSVGGWDIQPDASQRVDPEYSSILGYDPLAYDAEPIASTKTELAIPVVQLVQPWELVEPVAEELEQISVKEQDEEREEESADVRDEKIFREQLAYRCQCLVRVLMAVDGADVFNSPVDLGIFTAYSEQIGPESEPMDFGTILQKLRRKQYEDLDEFLKDMNMVFDNCAAVNRDSEIGVLGDTIAGRFDRLLVKWIIDEEKIPAVERLERCEVCSECDQTKEVMMCDDCDAYFHYECLDAEAKAPPNELIAQDGWFCPDCMKVRLKRLDQLKPKPKKKPKRKAAEGRPKGDGIFVSKIDTTCMKCGNFIIMGESHIAWARTGQWRGKHYHTKCSALPWPKTLEDVPAADPNYCERDPPIVTKHVKFIMNKLIDDIEETCKEPELEFVRSILMQALAKEEDAATSMAREGRMSQKERCVRARQSCMARQPELWLRLCALEDPIDINAIVKEFDAAEMCLILDAKAKRARNMLADAICDTQGITVGATYDPAEHVPKPPPKPPTPEPEEEEPKADEKATDMGVENGGDAEGDDSLVAKLDEGMVLPLKLQNIRNDERRLGVPRPHIAGSTNDHWQIMDGVMPQIGMLVRAFKRGRVHVGRISEIGPRTHLVGIKTTTGNIVSGVALEDLDYDPSAAIDTGGVDRRKSSQTRRRTPFRAVENVYRTRTDEVRTFTAERCFWCFDRQTAGHDAEAYSTVPSPSVLRRLARRGGIGAMDGFLYFLDEDNMQITEGPWALPVLTLPAAWRTQMRHNRTLAGIAVHAQILCQGIDETAMREPLRQQNAFDQKESTHTIIRQAEDDYDVQAALGSIITTLERTVEREGQIPVPADELMSLPRWAARSDGQGGLSYYECATGVTATALDVVYEPVPYSLLVDVTFIQVMYEEDDWRTAFVCTVNDSGALAYFDHMQQWSLLEPSVFPHKARRLLVEGEPVAHRPPWLPKLPCAGVIDAAATSIVGSIAKPARPRMSSSAQEHMYQLWEAVRYAADAAGREVGKWFATLPPPEAFPHYAQKIPRAVHLAQVRRKIVNGEYDSVESFEADMTLTFESARAFFPVGSSVVSDAVALQEYFWVAEKAVAAYGIHRAPTIEPAVFDPTRVEKLRTRGRRTVRRLQAEIRPRVARPMKGPPDVSTQVQQIVIAICQALKAAPATGAVPTEGKRKKKAKVVNTDPDFSAVRTKLVQAAYDSLEAVDTGVGAILEQTEKQAGLTPDQKSHVSGVLVLLGQKLDAARQEIVDAAEHDRRVAEYNEQLASKARRLALNDVERTDDVTETTMPVMKAEEQLATVFAGVLKAVSRRKKRTELFMQLPEKQTAQQKLPPKPTFPVPLTNPPAIPCGLVDKIGEGGRLVVQTGPLPGQAELQTWTADSQRLFWEQRKRFWGRLKTTELQRECRKRKMWPGGDQPYLKDRLIRYDCARGTLTPDELKQEIFEPPKPDYYEVVKRPIDLTMIKEKVDDGKFKTMAAFGEDMKLMFANARLYDDAANAGANSGEIAAVENLLEMEMVDMMEQVNDAAEHNKRMARVIAERDQKRKDEMQEKMTDLLDAISAQKEGERELHETFLKVPTKQKDPEYHECISDPIDLTKLRAAVEAKEIDSDAALQKKLLKMFGNARQFYGDESAEGRDADALEWLVHTVMGSTMPRALKKRRASLEAHRAAIVTLPTPAEVMLMVLDKVKSTVDDSKRQIALIFVDKPSKGLYPDYYEQIKHPIDLRTMEKKVNDGKYKLPAARTADIFGSLDADMDLLVANAKAYNPPESLVVFDADALHVAYREAKQVACVPLTAQPDSWKGLPKSCSCTDRNVPDVKARCRQIISVLLESAKYKERTAEKFDSMTKDEKKDWMAGATHGLTLEVVAEKLEEIGLNAGYSRVSVFAADVNVALNNLVTLSGIVTKAEKAAAKAEKAEKLEKAQEKTEEEEAQQTTKAKASKAKTKKSKTTLTVGGGGSKAKAEKAKGPKSGGGAKGGKAKAKGGKASAEVAAKDAKGKTDDAVDESDDAVAAAAAASSPTAAIPASPPDPKPDKKTAAKKAQPRGQMLAPLLETALRLRVMFERMVANWIVHIDAPPVGRLVYSDTDPPPKSGKGSRGGRGSRGGGRGAGRASSRGRASGRGRGRGSRGRGGGRGSRSSGDDKQKAKPKARRPKKTAAAAPGTISPSAKKPRKMSKARQHQVDCAQRLKGVWDAVCAVKDPDGHGCADIFMELPAAKDVPGYYEAIKQPMSLRQVESKIEGFLYADDDAGFAKDMKLIFDNARAFNPPDSYVVHDANKIEGVFQAQFKAMPPMPRASDPPEPSTKKQKR
jgi:hypothetical protein